MKEEIKSVFSLIQDYKDGVGGVTDAFIMNELKCLVNEAQQQVNSVDLDDVVGRSEHLFDFLNYWKKKMGGSFTTDILETAMKQYLEGK